MPQHSSKTQARQKDGKFAPEGKPAKTAPFEPDRSSASQNGAGYYVIAKSASGTPMFDLDSALQTGDHFEPQLSYGTDTARFERTGDFDTDCERLVDLSATKKRMEAFASEHADALLDKMIENGATKLELSDGRTLRVTKGRPQWNTDRLAAAHPQLFDAAKTVSVETERMRSGHTKDGWYGYCQGIAEWDTSEYPNPDEMKAHFEAVAATVPSRAEFMSKFPQSVDTVRQALWGDDVRPAVVLPDDYDESDYVISYNDDYLACRPDPNKMPPDYGLHFVDPHHAAEMLAMSRDYLKELKAARETFMAADDDIGQKAFLDEVRTRAGDDTAVHTSHATMQIVTGRPKWDTQKLIAERRELYHQVKREGVAVKALRAAAAEHGVDYDSIAARYSTSKPQLTIR